MVSINRDNDIIRVLWEKRRRRYQYSWS